MDDFDIAKNRALAKAQARPGKAYFAHFERKPGWSKALPIYVIWCDRCMESSATHPAGYGRITCLKCFKTVDKIMTWQRFRDKKLKPSLLSIPVYGIAILAAVLSYVLFRALLPG